MKTKKLVVAICLLLTSAVLVTTASFAWFSMNTDVDVDGIEVEAYSDALYLQISNNGSTYGDTTTFNATKKSLRLVTQVAVDTTALKTVTATPASGYPASGTTYYTLSDAESSGDTYAAFNYIKAESFGAATLLDAYYKLEFTRITDSSTYSSGTYYEALANGNGFKAATLTVGNALYGYYTISSYVVTEDVKFEQDVDYYQMDANRNFEKKNVTVGEDLDGVYFEKVAGVAALGTDAGVYTDADETNYAVYYTTDTSGNYVIATDLVPAEKLDDKYYTVEVADATATVAQDAKVWYQMGNNYICVYHNDTTAEVNLTGRMFWGKTYSDTLGEVGGADIGIIKEDKVANYVYSDTLYLRSAKNTNDGSNLRIEDIEISGRVNYLSPAMRIYFVATNSRGQTKTYLYDNGVSFTPETLFDKILGNEAEVVTVKTFIYFEGTDEAAFTATTAAGELNGQKVAIKFAINDVDYTVNP